MIGGIIAFMAAATAAQVGTEVGKAALPDRGTIVAAAVDTMFRPQLLHRRSHGRTGRPGATSPSTGQVRAAPPSTPTEARNEIAGAITVAVSDGKLRTLDRQHVGQIVAAQAGLPQAEAERRVDEAYAQAMPRGG